MSTAILSPTGTPERAHGNGADSRCPGHPEYRWTSGVETTTGPLGPQQL